MWDEKPFLCLTKKRLQTFQSVQKGIVFEDFNFAFMCARSAKQLGESRESATQKSRWKQMTNWYARSLRHEDEGREGQQRHVI